MRQPTGPDIQAQEGETQSECTFRGACWRRLNHLWSLERSHTCCLLNLWYSVWTFYDYHARFGERGWLSGRATDSWSKGLGFESRQVRRENFLRQGQLSALILFRYLFHPRVTAVAHKRSSLSVKSAGGRLQLNMHASYVNYVVLYKVTL